MPTWRPCATAAAPPPDRRRSRSVQAASIAAWGDEAHVVDNRARYRAKFAEVTPLLAEVLDYDEITSSVLERIDWTAQFEEVIGSATLQITL